MASLIVTEGTLKVGDLLVAGEHICKVKGMRDWQRKNVKECRPSQVVDVLGWKTLPNPGIVLCIHVH